ncbi:MAG: flagellar protein FlaG [Thermodesulfobacteriota bacterium]
MDVSLGGLLARALVAVKPQSLRPQAERSLDHAAQATTPAPADGEVDSSRRQDEASPLAPATGALSPQRLDEMLNDLNQALAEKESTVRFAFDRKAELLVVHIIDDRTGEVMRSIPPDHLRRIHETFQAGGKLAGLMVATQG